jgi:hypothetical protein
MKNTNSWYIGPVIGAISGRIGWPSTRLRSVLSTKKLATYVSVMCRTRTRDAITRPNVQNTRFVARSLPH